MEKWKKRDRPERQRLSRANLNTKHQTGVNPKDETDDEPRVIQAEGDNLIFDTKYLKNILENQNVLMSSTSKVTDSKNTEIVIPTSFGIGRVEKKDKDRTTVRIMQKLDTSKKIEVGDVLHLMTV